MQKKKKYPAAPMHVTVRTQIGYSMQHSMQHMQRSVNFDKCKAILKTPVASQKNALHLMHRAVVPFHIFWQYVAPHLVPVYTITLVIKISSIESGTGTPQTTDNLEFFKIVSVSVTVQTWMQFFFMLNLLSMWGSQKTEPYPMHPKWNYCICISSSSPFWL